VADKFDRRYIACLSLAVDFFSGSGDNKLINPMAS